MAETIIKGGLKTLQPESVWISDQKVAVCISDTGIVSCLFHGQQAVSRNAFFLKGNIKEPALRFVFRENGCEIPYIVNNCRYSINSCILEIDAAGYKLAIKIYAFYDSIFTEIITESEDRNIKLDFVLDSTKLVSDVYGNRKWHIESYSKQNLVLLTADDRTTVSEWTSKHGSFLVPLEIQNKIYIKDPLTDITFSQETPELKDGFGDDLFVNAKTFIKIGESGFAKLPVSNGNYIYSADLISKNSFRLKINFSSIKYNDMAEEQPQQQQKSKLPELIIPNEKSLENLFSFIPTVFDSVIQHDTGMPRACAGGYYWVWGWDTIVAAMELSKWGRLDQQKQIISFMLAHRWKNGTIPHRYGRNYEAINVKPGVTDALFLVLVKQYLEEGDDYSWLKENYNEIKEIWNGIFKDVEDGFIVGLGTYPDNPKAMGRNSSSRSAVDNGAFYFAMVSMLGFARSAEDKETAASCRELLDDFSQRYISRFFDEEKQMVLDSFSPNEKNLTYPVYSLISMSSRLGIPLLLNKQKAIADFIIKEYFGEKGFRALPAWDKNRDTESIHHSWFLYWDTCILSLLRTCGYTHELDTYRNNISTMWEKYRTIYEFIDLDHLNSDNNRFPWSDYGCSWPIHGTASVYRGILEGVLGLRTDMGCITILPGPVEDGSKLQGLMTNEKRWNFDFNGSGNYIEEIKVNNERLSGSMVIPTSVITRENMSISIYRSNKKPNELYIADIYGGRIRNVSKNEKELEAGISSDGYTTVLLHGIKKPAVLFNNEQIKVHDVKDQSNLYYLRIYEDGIMTIN